MRMLLVALGALVGLVACGARTSAFDDDEPLDCAVERQRVNDECAKGCGGVPSPTQRGGKTWIRQPDSAPTPCIEECVAKIQKECEATASCRCAQALTAVTGN